MSQLDLQAYLNTYHVIADAIVGLTEEQLKWKENANKWSITEVITHLTDHNLVVSFRIRTILSKPHSVLATFDQDQWIVGQAANEENAAHALQLFQALLTYNHLLFRRLKHDDLSKIGINAKGEEVDIYKVVNGFTTHVHHHLAQIDRIKQAYAAQELAKKGS